MTYPWRGNRLPPPPLAMENAARALGCETAALQAVWEVEARGRFYEPSGDVIDRFEPHKFPREHWETIGFRPRPARKVGGKIIRAAESPWRASLRLSSDEMFMRAYEIDPRAAIRASSWGAPQTMGFNCEAAGHESAEDMVRAYADSAQAQINGFVSTIQTWGIDGALRAHDWYTFARRYNGSGQPAHYARLIEAAYRSHSGGRRSPVVLSVGNRGEAVARLQRALDIEDDGVFGPDTHDAVVAHQRRHGLKVDGVVGRRTWTALEAEKDVKPKTQEPEPSKQVDLTSKAAGWTAAIGGGAATVQQASRAADSVNRVIPPEIAPYVWMIAVAGAVVFGTIYAVRRWA